MAVTPNSFRAAFPQFDSFGDEKITPWIAAAMLRAGPALGEQRDMGVMWLTAHYLAINPMNENMAQVKGAPGSSYYEQEYLKLFASCRPFGTTSGT